MKRRAANAGVDSEGTGAQGERRGGRQKCKTTTQGFPGKMLQTRSRTALRRGDKVGIAHAVALLGIRPIVVEKPRRHQVGHFG
jgi:hypothetical protein